MTDFYAAWDAKRRSEPPQTEPGVLRFPISDRHAAAALEGEAKLVREAQVGTRNHTLNVAAGNLGQLVALGTLSEAIVRDELTKAAQICGLEAGETSATITSGLRWGMQHPRQVPELQPRAAVNGSDPLAAGYVNPSVPRPTPEAAPPAITLDEMHQVFTRWLGAEYDTDVLDVVLATAACERIDGDPPWLLVVSGPGAAKTETITALAGAGGHVTSTISSEGALLSASPRRERSKVATGGLLRKIGESGLLVIKDVTSILSMNRDMRAMVLAALREIYDGYWERNVGTDGGHTLTWKGRLVVVGAVTTAWDTAHAVVGLMGDRFVLIRLDSHKGRTKAGRQAISNSGNETAMRNELATAVAAVLAGVHDDAPGLDEHETEMLLKLADIVTVARTAVERDYRGDVIDAHAPEMPTRFVKQLTMIVRGARALGINRDRALTLAIRCARDSMPPLRLAVLLDLIKHPASTTHAVRVSLDRPRTTVDQTLQCLHALGLVTVAEAVESYGAEVISRSVWRYSLTSDQHLTALSLMGGLAI